MQYDFDRIIDRRHTNAIATDGFRQYLFDGADDVKIKSDDEILSMWVADMAFASAPAAIEAMEARLRHPIFGYTAIVDDTLFEAFADWCDRYYSWRPDREHFVTSGGVVPALYDLVEHILEGDEKVATFTPAYAFFERAATYHDHRLVTCGLVESAGRYEIDLADLDAKLADPLVRLFFLCHPHNPTGRVFDEGELRRIAEICFENDVVVVSDEIHCDLLRTGGGHTPLAKLYPDSDQIITCMSASKTFNLAGLGIANIIIPNDRYREIWKERNFPIVNPVSEAAAIGVFRNGSDWLDQLRRYVDGNFELVRQTLADRLPDTRFRVPEATYLAWIDVGPYFAPQVDLTRFFAERAGVLLEGPDKFVADAGSHIRLNLACPRAMVDEALDRIVAATLER